MCADGSINTKFYLLLHPNVVSALWRQPSKWFRKKLMAKQSKICTLCIAYMLGLPVSRKATINYTILMIAENVDL